VVVAGRTLLSAGRDGLVRAWGVPSPVKHIEPEGGWVHRLAAGEGEVVAVTTSGDLLRLRGSEVVRWSLFRGGAADVVLRPDGLAVAAGDRRVVAVEAHGRERFAVETEEEPVALCLAADGRTAWWCGSGGQLGRVDLELGVGAPIEPRAPPGALQVVEVGGALIVGGLAGVARFGAEAEAGAALGPVFTLARSPAGDVVAAAGDRGIVFLLDPVTLSVVGERVIEGASLAGRADEDTAVPAQGALIHASSTASVVSSTFDPSGRRLFAGTIGGDLFAVDLPR
jgi:hypothetical protein